MEWGPQRMDTFQEAFFTLSLRLNSRYKFDKRFESIPLKHTITLLVGWHLY